VFRAIFNEVALFCTLQTTMIPCFKQWNFDECFDGDVIMGWGNFKYFKTISTDIADKYTLHYKHCKFLKAIAKHASTQFWFLYNTFSSIIIYMHRNFIPASFTITL